MSTSVQIQITDLAGARTGTADIDSDQAWALAQFLKRAHFGTCERLSDPSNKEEPQQMMDGLCALQRAMSGAGISPR